MPVISQLEKHVPLILLLLALFPAAVLGESRDISNYLLEAAEERRLAATAAPPAVSTGASYYRLTEEGFVMSEAGTNGWHCFVERAFWETDDDGEYDARIRAPHCINDAGARSRMQEVFLEAELAIAGLSRAEASAELDAAHGDGRLHPPDGFAMTYMMSPEQWLGEQAGHWHPHLMFWVPYLENADVGHNEPFGRLPFVDSSSGTRSAVLIVAVPPHEGAAPD
jgi:hypothetical protein